MPITKEEVRTVLTTWGEERLLGSKAFGNTIECHSINEGSAYRIMLQTQYETQAFGQLLMPASPSMSASSEGSQPNGTYSSVAAVRDVTASRKFAEGTHKILLPESKKTQQCSHCSGSGKLRCDACKSTGRVRCGFCGGMGFRTVARPKSTYNRGKLVMTTEMVREPCTCHMGKIRCVHCNGAGQVNCAPCEGHGAVHTWDTITHNFETRRDEFLLNESELPEKILKGAAGEPVWEGYLDLNGGLPPLPAAVQSKLQNVLTETREGSDSERHVLFRHLSVSVIPVHYVVYSAGKTSNAHLWIYGSERHVHAPSETGMRGLWNRFMR